MAPRTVGTLKNQSSSEYEVSLEISDFCKKLPKAELHLHIEGTLEPEMMLRFARRNNVDLPYRSIHEVEAAYRFDCLQAFLDLYYSGAAVLQTESDFEEVLFAYLIKAHDDGVVRAELFFDPQTHTQRNISFDTFMAGFQKAIARAENDCGISVGLIMCFLRHLPAADALETYKQAKSWITDKTIIGVGLDSSELDFPPENFRQVFALAKADGLHLTAHAGEEGPPEYVETCLDMGVERIDHGVRAEEDEALMDRLAASKIPLTVCPFSNVALKVVDDLEGSNFKRLLEKNLVVTINSDDPAYFGGYISHNYSATSEALGLSYDEIIAVARHSIQASFSTSQQKEQWLRKLSDYVLKKCPNKVAPRMIVPENF